MNGLRIHGVSDIKVKRANFESFTTITVTISDDTRKDFTLRTESEWLEMN